MNVLQLQQLAREAGAQKAATTCDEDTHTLPFDCELVGVWQFNARKDFDDG
jgi:hypothetical protein